MGTAVLEGQKEQKTLLGWQMRPKGAAKAQSIGRSTAPATVFARKIATIGASIPFAQGESRPDLVGAIEYSQYSPPGCDQTSV